MTEPAGPAGRGAVLAVTMFSTIPVPHRFREDHTLDRVAAGRVLAWLPAVGALLAAASGLVATAVLAHHRGAGLLAAAIAVTALVVLTGGLHLDGAADTADGLGSRRPAEAALQIMRAGDVGPFGIAAVVLVLLLDIAALSTVAGHHSVWTSLCALVVAATAGRMAAVQAGHARIPPARPDGFGALVAGSVTGPVVVAGSAATLVLTAVLAVVTGAPAGYWLGGVVIAWAGCLGVRRLATRRLGGMTGDVFGALVEVGTCLTLLVMAIA